MNNLLHHLHNHKPKRARRARPMRFKNSIWRAYRKKILDRVVAKWRALTIELLINKLAAIEHQVELERPAGLRKDSWPDEVNSQLDLLAEKYDLLAQQSRDIAAGTFDEVNGLSHRQWYAVAKQVLGVDILQYEPWIGNAAKAFIHENVGLISKTGTDVMHDIKHIVMTGFRQGKRWETLRDEILEGTDLAPGPFQKVETRAKIIARDQCTKLYADVNQMRQENVGLVWYTWYTVRDERVRGKPRGKYPKARPSHWMMDGKVCRWDDLTVYADSLEDAKAGKWKKRTPDMPKEHPGQPILCRCNGSPVFDTLFQ
jgi:hypothetical protein